MTLMARIAARQRGVVRDNTPEVCGYCKIDAHDMCKQDTTDKTCLCWGTSKCYGAYPQRGVASRRYTFGK